MIAPESDSITPPRPRGYEAFTRATKRITTARPLAVAVFTNEEGVRFQPDMMGSLVYAGALSLDAALLTPDAHSMVLGDELARIGYAGTAPCGGIRPHAYVELHIEQGPILHRESEVLGAVENLQGISWQEIVVTGVSNEELAGAEGVTIESRRLVSTPPVEFDQGIIRVIEGVARDLEQPIRRMTSGAGHDAQMMQRICPSAMIFVPGVDGISHNPREFTQPAHWELGANVLLHTMMRLDQ